MPFTNQMDPVLGTLRKTPNLRYVLCNRQLFNTVLDSLRRISMQLLSTKHTTPLSAWKANRNYGIGIHISCNTEYVFCNYRKTRSTTKTQVTDQSTEGEVIMQLQSLSHTLLYTWKKQIVTSNAIWYMGILREICNNKKTWHRRCTFLYYIPGCSKLQQHYYCFHRTSTSRRNMLEELAKNAKMLIKHCT